MPLNFFETSKSKMAENEKNKNLCRANGCNREACYSGLCEWHEEFSTTPKRWPFITELIATTRHRDIERLLTILTWFRIPGEHEKITWRGAEVVVTTEQLCERLRARLIEAGIPREATGYNDGEKVIFEFSRVPPADYSWQMRRKWRAHTRNAILGREKFPESDISRDAVIRLSDVLRPSYA